VSNGASRSGRAPPSLTLRCRLLPNSSNGRRWMPRANLVGVRVPMAALFERSTCNLPVCPRNAGGKRRAFDTVGNLPAGGLVLALTRWEASPEVGRTPWICPIPPPGSWSECSRHGCGGDG